MYRVLLVDDESLIVDGIEDYISKHRPNRYDIVKAYSGRGAIEMLERMRVDVMITDIEMMGLSGLDVHEQCMQRWKQCRTIFLTAHANFEYAYRAMQDQHARFILKSEGFEKVLILLEKTVEEIDDALLNEMLLREARRKEDAYILKYLFLRGILDGAVVSKERLEEGFRRFQIPMRADQGFIMALLHVYTREVGEGRLSLIGNYIARQVGDAYSCCGVQRSGNELICMFQSAREILNAKLHIASLLELWQPTFEKLCGCDVGFVIGEYPVEWKNADILLNRLHNALSAQGDAQSVFVIYRPDDQEERAFTHERLRRELCLALAQEEDVTPVIESIYASCKGLEAAFIVVRCLSTIVEEQDMAQLAVWGQTVGSLMLAQDANAACAKLTGFLNGVRSERSRTRGKRHDQVAEAIDHFIEVNFAKDITLSDIAYHVCLSPAYVSSLYKRLRGRNIMDTVLNVRMAHAKELLSCSDRQIQQIAAEVGYHSARYFISSFRNFYGMSPNAYREAQGGAREEKQI